MVDTIAARSSRVVLSAVALLLCTEAFALRPDRAVSQYAHQSWRIEDGLPNSVVRAIVQSDDGYIWIATYDGLARFNGAAFTRFDKGVLPALRRDTVLAFTKSRDGALWIGTNGGGAGRYRDGILTMVTAAGGPPSDVASAFCETRDGSMWIGTSEGLIEWRAGKVVRTLRAADGFATSASVLSIAQSADGTLWAGTRGGGLVEVREGRVARVFRVKDGLPSDSILSLMAEPDGRLLIGTGGGLCVLRGGTIKRLPGATSDQITVLLRDSDRTLWAGTYSNGLLRSADDTTFTSFTSREGLLNNSVRGLFEDAEKNLWVGTNGGLELFAAGKFITFGTAEGLSDPYTRSVVEDREGNVWIGTSHGLNRLSKGKITTFTTKDGMSSDYVLSVYEGHDGTLWVGTPTGLNRYANGRFTVYSERDGLSGNSVRGIFDDGRGTLWIGTDRGLTRYDGRRFEAVEPGPQWRITVVQAFAAGPDGSVWIGADGHGLALYRDGRFQTWTAREHLPDMHVLSLMTDADGTLWIGTDSAGLIRLRNGRFTAYTAAAGLASDKVVQILDDGAGRLWFGGGRGISYVTRRDLEDYADRKTPRVSATVFGYGDGLRSVQCNGSVSPAGMRGRDGTLWFPTVDGVATIALDRVGQRNLRPPPVRIESVVIDGQATENPSVVVVPPGASRIEIRYAALTYVAAAKVEFRYQLLGFDPDWVRAGNVRAAYYTAVPPGKYRFRVMASNGDGVWNRTGATMSLQLEPRFVQTVWFPLAVAALLLASGWLLQQRRVFVMRRREEKLVRLVDERTRAIVEEKDRTEQALRAATLAHAEAEQHREMLASALVEAEGASRAKSVFLMNVSHELRTPLNAIIGFSSALQLNKEKNLTDRQVRFVRNVVSSGQHLLALIDEILDVAKIEAGRMTLNNETLPLQDLFEGMMPTLRGLAVPHEIELVLDLPAGAGTIDADPVKLRQILYNLASNAAKFSPRGSTIRIVVRPLEAAASPIGTASVSIAVIDQGIGIPAEHHQSIFQEFHQLRAPDATRPAGTGLGLALVKRLVELHSGTVRVESLSGGGATFTVVLPRSLA